LSFYCLPSLEDYFLGNFADNLKIQAEQLSRLVRDQLAEPDPGRLEELLAQVVGQPDRVMILDSDGYIITGTGDATDPAGKRLTDAPILNASLGGTPQQRRVVDPDTDQRFLEYYQPIVPGASGPVAGVVYVSSSLEPIYQNLADIRGILFSATSVALALVGILAFFLARTIAGPIREITHRASLMAAGDFDQEIQIRSRDEVGQLAAMFNYLTMRLRQTLAEIAAEKQKVEAILQHMADGILALDRAGTIILVNPAARQILHLSPERRLEGLLPSQVLPDFDVMPLVRRALMTRSELSDQLSLEEPERVLEAHVTPLWTGDDEINGFVVVLHDITEQQKLERMRKEFVANVSHELRTPLTTIKSYVETLLEGAMENRQVGRRFLNVVDSEADRMNRLVADLLQLSQIDYLQVRWDRKLLPVSELVDDVYDKLHGQAERSGVELACEYSDGLYVYGDFDRLQQVLLNLASNALKFTPEGGTVDLVAQPKGRDFVEFVVRDNGVGIPEDDLPRVFDRFYRVDKARSRELGGTGLGLAIAREIVGYESLCHVMTPRHTLKTWRWCSWCASVSCFRRSYGLAQLVATRFSTTRDIRWLRRQNAGRYESLPDRLHSWCTSARTVTPPCRSKAIMGGCGP